MNRLLILCLCVTCLLGATANAQTVYNPPSIQFESSDHAMVTFYRAEFLVATNLTRVVQSADVPVSKVEVLSPGPPITYKLKTADIPVFLPFGQSYVLRLVACKDALCSVPSEVTRETIRYSYCAATTTTIRPLSIVMDPLPIGVVGAYANIVVTLDAPKPVHSVAIDLMGDPDPAFYFTGTDLRGKQTFTVGPFKRTGRFLVKLDAADEAGCSSSLASQYMTVK